MAKIALLIGVSEYEPDLNPLPGAVKDVDAMQRVLQDPAIGGFAVSDVKVLKNPERQAMEDAIFALFDDRQKDDLVLLYFSGHGITDDRGEFYLGTRRTRKQEGRLITPSAVAARDVHREMDRTRSRRLVVILDCCFGAAFAKGVTAKDSGSVNIHAHLGGEGRAILTAANSIDYAFEQEGLALSIYTHYLVEGLEKGAADQDDDGWISTDELHEYSSKVKEAAPAMSPEFFPVREGYKILLAKSPKDDPKLQYRKQVKLLVEENDGGFSFINRQYLDNLQLIELTH